MHKKIVLFLLFLFSSHELTAQTDYYRDVKSVLAGSSLVFVGLGLYIIIKKRLYIPSISFHFARFLYFYVQLNRAIENYDKKFFQKLLTIVQESPIKSLHSDDWNKLALKTIHMNDADTFNLLFTNKWFPSCNYYIKGGEYLSAACKAEATDIVNSFCKLFQSNKYDICEEDRNNICDYINTRIATNQNMDHVPYLTSLVGKFYTTWDYAIENMRKGNFNLLKHFISNIGEHFNKRYQSEIFVAACKADATQIISLLCRNFSENRLEIINNEFAFVYNYLISQAKLGNEFIISTIFNWFKKDYAYINFAQYIIKREQANSDCILSKNILQSMSLDTSISRGDVLFYFNKLLMIILLTGCEKDNIEMLSLLKNHFFSEYPSSEYRRIKVGLVVDYLNKQFQINREIVDLILLSFSKTTNDVPLKLWKQALQKNYTVLAHKIQQYYKLSLKTRYSDGRTIFHTFIKALATNPDTKAEKTLKDFIAEDAQTTDNNLCAINIPDYNGNTPLHIAVNKGGVNGSNIIKILITHPRIQVNIKNNKDTTPLLLAAESTFAIDKVNTLLSCEKINIHEKNLKKQTFFFSLFQGYRNFRLSALSDMPYFTSMTTAERQTFFNNELHSILFIKSQQISLSRVKDFINFCVQNGTDLNNRNDRGKRPVDIAKEQYRIFKKLPYFNNVLIEQEQLYYLFLRKTPVIATIDLYHRLKKVSVNVETPHEVINHILSYYHRLTIQRHIALFAKNDPHYYQMAKFEKRNIKKMILYNLYKFDPRKVKSAGAGKN